MTQKKSAKADHEKLLKKRAELEANGITLSELCAEHDINYQAARSLLCGVAKGRRGATHKAAVFLGLKPNPKQSAA